MISRSPIVMLSAFLVTGTLIPVLADRGMLPLTDVSVFGPGQKAILAWNGQEEVLILSTDVYAEGKTMILEVLPLPSEPDLIEKTDLAPFMAIESLLSERGAWRRTMGRGEGPGIEIVFHEKIGAHDVTVLRVDDSGQFEEWANRYLEESNMVGRVDSAKLAFFVESYIENEISYFVLDLIEVSSEARSIEPIIFRFRSSSLYFPLRISAMASGEVDIALFILSDGTIIEEDLPYPLSIAEFTGPLRGPVRFRVKGEDLEEIDPRIWELFDGDVWLTAVKYSGPLKDLADDLSISEVQTPLGEALVASPIFWLAGGVALGVTFGLLVGHVSTGALRIEFKRLVSTIDFIGIMMLMILSSVLAYTWAGYVFWILVPLGVASLYFSIRTGGRMILLIYLALPFLAILLILTAIVGRTLPAAVALVLFAGFLAGAAFPPAGRRELTSALRRSSRWIVASTRKRRL